MSFAQQVRDAIRDNIGDREFRAQDVALHLNLVSKQEKQPLYHTLRDFKKRGEIKAVGDGVFKYALNTDIRPAEKKRKMWSLLRSRRTVTFDDMVAMAGVQATYAKEFFQSLARQGIVRRIDMPDNKPSKWQMIVDPVKMPRDEEKAAKLRALRAAKKQAQTAIDQAAQSMIGATQALANLKTALGDLPEDEDG